MEGVFGPDRMPPRGGPAAGPAGRPAAPPSGPGNGGDGRKGSVGHGDPAVRGAAPAARGPIGRNRAAPSGSDRPSHSGNRIIRPEGRSPGAALIAALMSQPHADFAFLPAA